MSAPGTQAASSMENQEDKEKSLMVRETEAVPERPLDIERLRRCIIEFVHENFLEVVFWQMQTANKDFDEMLGVQAVVLLSKMDEKERGVLLMELVTIVHEASPQWRQEYERVVDAILYYAHAAGVLSINMCVEGLALTADFTLRTIMDPQKWSFIEENIPLMDYKGILLKILDPDLNVIPPIFTLTELSRGILKRAYMFPRLAHRLSELIMYFRAVAELSYVIGRCFLFPLPAHPSFAASAASCRIDHLTTQISHRAPYLPYKAELRAPQTYLLYTVIRQPHGKEVLSGLLRQVTHGRTQWDEILSVLISETMAEVRRFLLVYVSCCSLNGQASSEHYCINSLVFWQMQTANKDLDEMLGVQAVVLLSKMDEKERGVLLMELVTIVHEASPQWRQEYERVVDAILYYAHAAGVLSINMCVEGLALTADFTLRTIMDPQKWSFIEENIPLMDYKGVRSLFKCLIYQQFNSIPAQLSPEQRRQLLPAERFCFQILLKILDPDLNVIPPIFTLTELSRGILKRAYMFPRLAHRLSELIMYFRAVAELSYVIGRCFLFPLPAHPSFAASAASCRIDHLTTQIRNLSRLLSLLSNVLVKTGYRRARDEVMWIMLQIAGTFQPHLQKEQVEEMARLYNLLFNDDVVWTGASDHPSQLVRFLAAACMWNILDGSEGLPPPSECLANQIEFVRSNNGPPDEAMQAVLDNAFRHESPTSRSVHAIFQQRLDGQPTDEPHILPYGRAANNKLDAFDMQFLDALTLRAKINLLISTCFVSLHKVDRLPSPACVETCARILTSIEFDYGLTNFIAILNRSITAALSPAPPDGLNHKDQCYMLLDLLCYRLPSIPMNFRAAMSHSHDPTPAGLRLCMTIHSAMAQQQVATNHLLYSAMEHTLMRQWAWNLLPDTISLAHLFVDNAFGNTLLNLNSWLVYNPMENTRMGRLVVCPEIVRMLLITMMRAMKIMGVESDPELMRINQVYTWAPSQLSSLPLAAQRTAITLEEDPVKAEAFQREVHTDFMQMRGQPEMSWMEYMSMPSRQPTILCVIFRFLMESPPEHQMLQPVTYQILDRQTCREHVLAVNALTDYIISQCSAEKNSEEFLPMIRVLNMMVFHWHVMTFDRLLLSLVLHPATDHASQIAMVIVQALLNCTEINERIDFYCRYIPRRDVDAPEHFRRLAEYHRKFPEMTFGEMASRPPMMTEILDFTLARALELQVDNIFSTILTTCGPIYKFHPYPITFLYTILFCMHEQLGHHPRARQFVLAILCQGDQSSLTQSFINDNHQRVYSFEELVYELADRIITCSEFILTPPSYVAPDWRFAEYPPAAQALYLACIELLASPHTPEHIVPAMINLLVSSRAQPPRPYLLLNAIALLLTALPEAYCRVLQNEFLAVIDSGVLSEMTFEEIVFDEFEERQLLQMASRPLIVNVVAQAYWYHSNLSSLSKLISTFAGEVCSRANTENDLWYALRLVVPLLQRCYDWREKVKHEESLKVVSILYTKIGDITERYGDILHGDELCDLLYYFKYMFVGDFLRKEAEAAFPRILYTKIGDITERYGDILHGDELCDLLYYFKYMFVGDFLRKEAEAAFPRYWGDLSWRNAEKLLLLCEDGSFLVRDSHSDNHLFTISYKHEDRVLHSRVEISGQYAHLGGPLSLERSESVVELLKHAVQISFTRERDILIHRRGAEAEASGIHLRYPLSRLQLLPRLQYLCRLKIRLLSRTEKLSTLPLPPSLIAYVSDPKFLIPNVKECLKVLEERRKMLGIT
ncbi:SH2 domain protein [Oesophagostomum dentatum]|uniref:Mediator of RNA polymerase II transcription subunit 23 n=1 Tax=Oesophagostomum dentatum TaxID=61180 RepID=A0A0B1T5T6_OESDE|nr:SH2 domain protein [Oesophagostomum dentatum]